MATTDDGTTDELRESFDQFDKDDNGQIDRSEFAELVAILDPGMPEEQVSIGFGEIDSDSNGAIDFAEFAEWWDNR
ncbi:EF-hand domain-containing protein [Lolliginicoccus suaedae]|uniref:EF-hand domain-containing protein n=1 Tax=Lolliginicoccus suaedae TaxID=2605429 RepID=UPI0011EDEC45|nr:EF-hand domain-containing protein [Lolliginicoccus suaedae]